MEKQKRELLDIIQVKDDLIAQLQLQLQLNQKDASFAARENANNFGKSFFIEDNDASAMQHSQGEGEELKQCDALFGQIQNEKSRFSIIESRISIIDCDYDKSGIPAISGGAYEEGNSNNTMIMFDDNFLKDMNTGTSLKQ